MKILGCLYAPRDLEQAGYNGLRVANAAFLDALIRYSDFDAIHIFSPSGAIDYLKNYWRSAYESKRVQFFPVHDLAYCLQQTEYAVFHTGEPWIDRLADMRQMYAIAPFPITGRAHSLNQDIGLKQLQNVVLADHYPWDSILCSSQASRTVFEKMFQAVELQHQNKLQWQGRLDILPLGVESLSLPDKTTARERLGISPDCFLMLSLGRFSASDKMDLHPLLLALREMVFAADVPLCLYLAGDGEPLDPYVQSLLSTSCELLIDDSVRFDLEVDEQKKQLLLAAADVFISVADSYQESFGITPVEAMMAELPVVLSDWNGYQELISDGVEGFKIPTVSGGVCNQHISSPYDSRPAATIQAGTTAIDVNHLIKVLSRMAGDREMCRKQGLAGRKRAKAIYSWPVLVAQYQNLITELNRKISESADWQPAVNQCYDMPVFFQHYSTSALTEDAQLTLTDRGWRVLLEVEDMLLSEAFRPFLSRDNVLSLLSHFQKPNSVGGLKSKTNMSAEVIHPTTAWMLKYHLLQYADSTTTCWVHGSRHVKRLYALWSDQVEAERQLAEYAALVSQIKQVRFQDQSVSEISQKALFWLCAPLFKRYRKQLPALDTASLSLALFTPFAGWLESRAKEDWIKQPTYLLYLFRISRQWRNDSEILFARLLKDLPELLQGAVGDGVQLESLSLHILPDAEFLDVIQVTLNQEHSVVYKNRDMRAEAALLGVEGGLFSKLNQWSSEELFQPVEYVCCTDADGIHYGYMDYIEADDEKTRYSGQGFKSLGALSAVALLLGIKDLHEGNILRAGGLPCLVDAELMLSADVLYRLNKELINGCLPVSDELDSSALACTNIFDFHHADALALTESESRAFEEGFLMANKLFVERKVDIVSWVNSLSNVPVRFCQIPRIHQSANVLKVEQTSRLGMTLKQTRAFCRWQAVSLLREQYLEKGDPLAGFHPDSCVVECHIDSWCRGRTLTIAGNPEDNCKFGYDGSEVSPLLLWKDVMKLLGNKKGAQYITSLATVYGEYLGER